MRVFAAYLLPFSLEAAFGVREDAELPPGTPETRDMLAVEATGGAAKHSKP